MSARFLTLDDIVAELGIAKSTASTRVRLHMEHFRDGEVIRVPREAFDRYLASRMVHPQEKPQLSLGNRAMKRPAGSAKPISTLRPTQPRRKVSR